MNPPLRIRGTEFGGPNPLFCIPLVAGTLAELLQQSTVAHDLGTDIVEWRADSFDDFTEDSIARAAEELRKALPGELILFTPRARLEGGAREIPLKFRASCIHRLLRSTSIDLVDIELSSDPAVVAEVIDAAHEASKHVIVSFHDFEKTPSSEFLSEKISAMIHQRADVAKIACMPRNPEDVLRLLDVTLAARRKYPSAALCTISMGGLGVLSRVAGFLYGSDMTFAAGAASSAPGQVPIAEARALTDLLLRDA